MTSDTIERLKRPFWNGFHFKWFSISFRVWKGFSDLDVISKNTRCYLASEIVLWRKMSFLMTSFFSVWYGLAKLDVTLNDIRYYWKSVVAFLNKMSFQMTSDIIRRLKWPFWARCHFKWHPMLFCVWNGIFYLEVNSNEI